MTFLKRLQTECPTDFFWLIVCVCLIPVGFLFEALTFGMRFFWFFVRFLLLVAAVHQLCSVCMALQVWSRTARWIRRIIRIGVLVWFATFLVMLAVIVAGGQADDEAAEAPFIVVLGAGLNHDEPSLVLRQRLDKALELSRENPDATLILCGGLGHNAGITEAEAMRRYLTERGVAAERMILEDTSRDTAQNLANAAKLMREISGGAKPRVALVTCSFHMMRGKLLAERNGMDVYAAPSPTRPQEFHYYLREYFSMLIYLVELTGITVDTWGLNL